MPSPDVFPTLVMLVVFVLIAARQFVSQRLRMWHIVSAGAAVVLLTGQITLAQAAGAINFDVIVFLVGMFIIAAALESSGGMERLVHRILRSAPTTTAMLALLVFGAGIISLFIVNDALAIICVPVALALARDYGVPYKPLLLAFAFAITTGSTASPIGNPQNLLIAASGGIAAPFISFFGTLLAPTMINLAVVFAVIWIFYRKDFTGRRRHHARRRVPAPRAASTGRLFSMAKASVVLLALLVVLDVALEIAAPGFDFRLSYFALAALPLLLFAPGRKELMMSVNWRTIIFFVSLFVLAGSVFQSGYLQSLLAQYGAASASVPVVMLASVAMSQLVSNVPFTIFYIQVLASQAAPAASYLALAAGSTTAGNLLLLGAVSNVIIVQGAERRGRSLTFWEFAKVGVPLTLVNMAVYLAFLML